MYVADFKNNIDYALDEYLKLSQAGRPKEGKDKILSVFQDIQANPGEIAELITLNPHIETLM